MYILRPLFYCLFLVFFLFNGGFGGGFVVLAGSIEFEALGRKEAVGLSRSGLLKGLVGGWFSGWEHGRKGRLLGHALDEEALRGVLHEAYYYGVVLRRLLGVEAGGVHVVVVEDRRRWVTDLEGAMPHRGVQSFYVDGVVFLYRPAGEGLSYDLADLPHELVHAWVDAWGEVWPLWLEEGLALSWGERLAKKYFSLQGRYVEAAEVEGLLLPLDPTRMRVYPEDEEEALRFYRSSKVLVRAIEELLNDGKFRTFISEMVKPGARWQDVLQEQWAVSDEVIDAMQGLLSSSELKEGFVSDGEE